MKKYLLSLILSLLSGILAAGTFPLIPYPQSLERVEGEFILGTQLPEINRIPVTITYTDSLPAVPVNQHEAYHLLVTPQQITIQAVTEQGVYWASQTLRQLIHNRDNQYYIPCCEILDWPAFRIRGFMHDTGRSYISVEELKREISMLSRYKINVFHWHLTENQAWRLESRRYPQLNEARNMTRMPGKYYTREEARDIAEHCREHNVILIPEIEMPGHSAAFERAFGFDMQSQEGLKITKDLLDEVCEIFSEEPYIHIGTDEVKFTNPRFVPEVVAHVRSKGKKAISWNPGWNYQPGEIDMLQMWSYRGKPHPGIPVIDSRLHYINHYDAFADLVALYNSNIAGQQQGSHDFAGSVLALWNDRLIESEQDIIIQNGFYPAMLTLAERTWRGGGVEYIYTRGSLMDPVGTEGHRNFTDFEDRLLYHKEHNFKGYPFAYVRQSNVRWRISDAFPNGGNLNMVFPPEQTDGLTEFKYNDKTYGTREAVGAGIYLRHVWGSTVPSFYDNPQPNHTAYAWTYVYSPRRQDVGLWAATQNYGRSEKDLPPPPGKWDYKESLIWINGNSINPPQWSARHTEPGNEIPLGNENFEVRPPIPVVLEKGWNKVLLKLPVGGFTTPEVRLVKWMFNFVFVTPDGERAVDDLIYSPDAPAQPRTYSTYYYQRASLFECLPVTPEDIVFLGNSITDGSEWNELFNDPRIKNRGISGDTTNGVYDRLESILKGKPAKIFLLIGTNDIAQGITPDTIVSRIGLIVSRIKTESPCTKLYLQSILPVNDCYNMFKGHTSRWQHVSAINNDLHKLARNEQITYVDLNSHFADESGKLKPEFSNDGLHLMGHAYVEWAKIIKPLLTE